MPGLAAADDHQALVGVRQVGDEARAGAARLPARIGVGDRLRRRPHGLGLAGQREGAAPEHPLEAGQRRQRVVEHERVHVAPRPPLRVGAETALELEAGAGEALREDALPASAVAEEAVVAALQCGQRARHRAVEELEQRRQLREADRAEEPLELLAGLRVQLEREVAQERRGDGGAGRGGAHLAVPAAEDAERAPLDVVRALEVAEQVAYAHQRQRADVGLDPRQIVRRRAAPARRAARRSAARGTGSATRSRSGAGSRRRRCGCWR